MNRILKAIKHAALVGVALLAPQAMAAINGAIYTSVYDGTIVNENVGYEGKQFVYLNGGPQNTGGSELTPGQYFFQVTTPNDVLLSTDSGWCRMISVGSDGRFAGAFDPGGGLCTTGVHANGATNPANGGGVSVQLIPYLDTTNNGGEYKVWLIEAGCSGLTVEGSIINFKGGCKKTDNFKVKKCANGLPADPNGICQTPPELCPDGVTPIPEGGVGFCPCPDGSTPTTPGVCLCPDGVTPIPPPPGTCEQNRPPLIITVTGSKYLDLSADGVKGPGAENGIANVDINLTVGSDLYTLSTDGAGNWSRQFSFDPDPNDPNGYLGYPVSFKACEEAMSGNWVQTGPLVGALSGSFASLADANRCWTMGTLDNDTGLDFGNICVGVAGGGLTKGFWHNKNGYKVMTTNMLPGGCYPTLVASVPLIKPDGTLFVGTILQFQNWLVNTNASNMASQLSAQTAAMWLNVKCNPNGVADGSMIYEPSLTQYGIGNSLGFSSINDVLAAAIAELNAHPNTVGGPYRAKQEALKTALDRGNNNLNWVGNASTCIPLDDWQIITLPQ
jgi:hypothetical protein